MNTYDDAFTADKLLTVNGGTLNAESCYEGLEGSYVEINGGVIKVVSSDDGINAACDDTRVKEYIKITGGDVTVKSGGDGIDSNGSITISGGVVTVYGATTAYDGGLDADGNISVNGGTVFVTTTSGMVEIPSTTSKQYVLTYADNAMINAGTVVKLTDASGEVIIERTVLSNCQSIVISSEKLALNGVYKLYAGESELCTFTVTSIITSVGNSGGGFPGGDFPGGGFPGGPGGGFPGSFPG